MNDREAITPDSFRFFRTFYEASKMIGNEIARLRFYDAISEYVFLNKNPSFLGDDTDEGRVLNIAWLLVKPVIDKSIANSKGGRNSKGVRPSMKGNKNAQKQQDYNSQSTVKQQSINRDKDKDIGIGLKEESIIKKKRFNFLSELTLLGVSEQTAADFMAVRKQKKATNTQTAFNRIKSEISKAITDGVSAEDCIRMAVENSWQGFEYDWFLKRRNVSSFQNPKPKSKVISGADILKIYG